MYFQTYDWIDKYVSILPYFINRVKKSYEWNKYFQAHYDEDNPPPLIVQGYRFNIFYPDIVDKSKPPTYHLENTDHPDFCIIRFSGGAPYEVCYC